MYMFKGIFISAIIVLTTITSASSDDYNINSAVDEILNQLGNYLKGKTLEETILPDFGLSGAPIFLGVSLTDLSTVYRNGDCILWKDNNLLKVKMSIGLKQMKIHVADSPALQGPVDLEITGAKAEVNLTLSPDHKKICVASWDFLNINTLGNIILHSSNKIYDGQPLDKTIMNAMILYYNQFLNRQDLKVNIHLISKYVELCSFPATITTFNEFKQ